MPTKRGIIQFNGATEKLRISVPGVDVDSAAITEFLLHETALYSQPYFAAFVTCPFAGSTSASFLEQDVAVTVPDVTSDPVIMFWVVDSDAAISYPCQRAAGAGSTASGFAVNAFVVATKAVSSTQISVRFTKPANSTRSPAGAYLTLMRKPDLV